MCTNAAALLDYGDSVLGDACTSAVGGESVHRASKTQSISAEKVLDAPTLVDDYCEYYIQQNYVMYGKTVGAYMD